MDNQGWINATAEKWQKTATDMQKEACERLAQEGLIFHSREIAWQWESLREDLRLWEALGDQKMIDATAQDMDSLVEQDELLEMLHFDETTVDTDNPWEPESISVASCEEFDEEQAA